MDLANDRMSQINTFEVDRFWLAFVEPTDPLLTDVEIPASADRVRIVCVDDFPVFALFYCKRLKIVTPYQVLHALAEGRITFQNEQDKIVFSEVLSNSLHQYDTAISNLERSAKVVGAVALVAASAALVGALAFAFLRRK